MEPVTHGLNGGSPDARGYDATVRRAKCTLARYAVALAAFVFQEQALVAALQLAVLLLQTGVARLRHPGGHRRAHLLRQIFHFRRLVVHTASDPNSSPNAPPPREPHDRPGRDALQTATDPRSATYAPAPPAVHLPTAPPETPRADPP